MPNPSDSANANDDRVIDLGDIFRRLGRGLAQTIGLALLGLTIAALIFLAANRAAPVSTSTRVVFSFSGFGKGLYPDGSRFTLDDVTAPDVIANALQRLGVSSSSDFQARIRASVDIEGIVPSDIAKVHDRMRSTGETPPPYFPDEYAITLTVPRNFPLRIGQRESLLGAIVTAYREKFIRTYAVPPVAFGAAFDTLSNADIFDYDQILVSEIDSLRSYLSAQADRAKDFRSLTTNLSFEDLLDQLDFFSKVRLDTVLGLIQQNGLSTDADVAMTKIDYDLETLGNQEQAAVGQVQVVQTLLNRSQDYAQNYVLGIKSQAAQPKTETPTVDQGLVDSLLANDPYSLLIRKALASGLKLKEIQAEKDILLRRREHLAAFRKENSQDKAALMAKVQKSLVDLKGDYQTLIANIRSTQADFANQEFADAIRIVGGIYTPGILKPLAMTSLIGMTLGAALGMGLSLLEIHIGEKRARRSGASES